jgi:hypothetical protein
MNSRLDTRDDGAVARLIEDIKERYSLIDALAAAGTTMRPAGAGWLAASCPFPNHSEKRPSFKINRSRPHRFKCFGCGEHGDVLEFVRLYYGCATLDSQLRQLTGYGLRDLLADSLLAPRPLASGGHVSTTAGPPPPTYSPLPVEVVAAIYERLLALLPLDADHRRELLEVRRFDPQAAYALGYRTLPVERYARVSICKRLISMGIDLWRVPGFFRLPPQAGQDAGRWCFCGSWLGLRYVTDPATGQRWPTRGMLVPTRNYEGRIVQLKIRNSARPDALGGSGDDLFWPEKYMAVTSARRYGGASASPTIHYAGPRESTASSGRRLWVTEGEIKADITAHQLVTSVSGMPGVSQSIEMLVADIREHGYGEVLIAYDAERKVNVHTAIRRLAVRCIEIGVAPQVVIWDGRRGKGIDDLLAAGGPFSVVPAEDWWTSALSHDERSVVTARLGRVALMRAE